MATGKTNTRWYRLYVGSYDLSGVSRSLGSFGVSYDETPVNGWADGVVNYTLGHPTLTFDGYQAVFSNANTVTVASTDVGPDTSLKTLDESKPVTLEMGIRAVVAAGDPAFLFQSRKAEYTIAGDGPVMVGARFPHDTTYLYSKPWGYALVPYLSAGTTATTNYSSVDLGASATTAIAHLHIYATSSGNFSFLIQQSATGAFAGEETTLYTFSADGSAVASEVAEVSTISRYIRFRAARTGGSVRVACGFAVQT